MKVLWVTNILLPEASNFLNIEKLVVGGWMEGLLSCLRVEKTLKLAVASVYKGNRFINFDKHGVTYFLIPSKRDTKVYNPRLETYWLEISKIYSPDLVHIHGTEHAHGLALINSCPNLNYVISIQGLVSVYSKYFAAGISNKEILINYTLKDLIKGSILKGKKDYRTRGINELKYLRQVKDIIGRTRWDKTHTYFFNKNRSYHFCNEVLRDAFYKANTKWNFDNIEPHSLFLSQANYPIKGFHFVLKAVALLKDEFPNIKIYIAGRDIIKKDSLIDRLKLSGYGRYIINLIKENRLEKSVFFTGQMNENQMIEMYLKANVFICPSSIENSPNSLGEAQILGVPTIASYVGGVTDMVKDRETGLLYRFEEFEELAYCIKEIFSNTFLAKQLSEKGKQISEQRHCRETIMQDTLKIYETIINSISK